jgi:hypothetical protein
MKGVSAQDWGANPYKKLLQDQGHSGRKMVQSAQAGVHFVKASEDS